MRSKHNGRILFTCDECRDTLETDEEELDEADRFMKEQGWLNVPKDKLPHHIILRANALNSGMFANLCDNCLDNLE